MERGIVKSCVFLTRAPVKSYQFKIHLSYFLQNCKKCKSRKGFAQFEKRYHNINLIPAIERYISVINLIEQCEIGIYRFEILEVLMAHSLSTFSISSQNS
jgi:hypothetical protein